MYQVPSNAEMLSLIPTFPKCSTVTTDNDPMFISEVTESLFRSYKIKHHTTPISHSLTNGQIDRAHSTILKLARSLAEQRSESVTEVLYRAVREYNN